MKRFSNDKDIHRQVRQLLKQGWEYRAGKRHGAIVSPKGDKLAIPSTPSDYRALRNFCADIRRINDKELSCGY